MTTTRQAFEKFLDDISITEYQKTSIVVSRRTGVEADLKTVFPASSDMPCLSVELMGSAAKGTIVRPIDDVDVLAVFSNGKNAWSKYQYDSKSFLYRVRNAYDGYSTAQVGARGQAVRVFYESGGHVDIAPVFHEPDMTSFLLPAGDGSWISTAPFVANQWFKETNAALGYNLAPLVRLAKKWNGSHSKRLRSFHMETMAGHTFSSLGSNHRDGLQKFFEWAPRHFDVQDPGGKSGNLASYMSWALREEVQKSMVAASERAVKALAAEAADDHPEAIRLWGIILGEPFGS